MLYTSKQVGVQAWLEHMYSSQNDPHAVPEAILIFIIFFFNSDPEVIPISFKERNGLLHCGVENSSFLDSLNNAEF